MIPNPVLGLHQFSYSYGASGDWVLDKVSLEVLAGQCHCVSGPTGCGKTTLLMAIRGLLPGGRQAGKCVTAGGQAPPGMVMQNPANQLLGVHLGAEVAFGLENQCVPPRQMPTRVREILTRVGLNLPLHTPVAALSMGQQYRACLAGALVTGPDLILMDEPVSQLDPHGLEQLKTTLARLKEDGKAMVICDHRPDALGAVVDFHWFMDRQGRLTAARDRPTRKDDFHSRNAGIRVQPHTKTTPEACGKKNTAAPGRGTGGQQTVIRVKDVLLHDNGDANGMKPLSFTLDRGQQMVVCGPNGSGKTTLVKCLAGLLDPRTGKIEVFGATPRPAELRNRLGVLFQNPCMQLFETTVFDEVAFAARRQNLSPKDVARRVQNLLENLDLLSLADLPPHALSYGQKHLVGLAAVAAGDPEILILDDPLAGLDREKKQKAMGLLAHLSKTRDTTIIWTSHHQEFPADWTHRMIRLENDPAIPDSAENTTAENALGKPRIPLKMPAGIALSMAVLLSMCAFTARNALLLAVLTAVNLALLLLRCPRPLVVLRRGTKLLVWQSVVIVLLYNLRFGWPTGFAPGVLVAWQLFLAFWPGIILTASTSFSRITRALARVLSHQTAFVVATCLRFLPTLLSEMDTIRQVQIFRGAGLLNKDLKNPRRWPDWLHCLLVPTLVRALALAGDISLAATARDFGRYKQRTYWPGDK